jgi:TIGR00251 family protein
MTDATQPWLRQTDHEVRLTLYIQPGAKKTEVCGEHNGALKIRLAAPPVDGKANIALRRFLADVFSVPLSRVRLERGELARQKIVVVQMPVQIPEWFRQESTA